MLRCDLGLPCDEQPKNTNIEGALWMQACRVRLGVRLTPCGWRKRCDAMCTPEQSYLLRCCARPLLQADSPSGAGGKWGSSVSASLTPSLTLDPSRCIARVGRYVLECTQLRTLHNPTLCLPSIGILITRRTPEHFVLMSVAWTANTRGCARAEF